MQSTLFDISVSKFYFFYQITEERAFHVHINLFSDTGESVEDKFSSISIRDENREEKENKPT